MAALIAALAALALVPGTAFAQSAPPNLVPINDHLVTSGQPSAEWLAGLKAQGFDAVIYLAPPTVEDAVKDEPLIVGRQGLAFVNIPIPFDKPTDRDYEVFAGIMKAMGLRKVLVHCQINLRASSMVFLYQAIANHEDPDTAYKSVVRVWAPDRAWKAFLQAELAKHGIAFEPY